MQSFSLLEITLQGGADNYDALNEYTISKEVRDLLSSQELVQNIFLQPINLQTVSAELREIFTSVYPYPLSQDSASRYATLLIIHLRIFKTWHSFAIDLLLKRSHLRQSYLH